MNRIRNMENSVFGAAGSSTDANRLYSILLDTRASAVSENMYDIAEKLMKNEKDNAKMALEQLWSLKKNLADENIARTVDMLINFYQEKLDVLRGREEHIRKVSKDSRELLEEKRKRDSEVATVKQEMEQCSVEVERLNTKMHVLEVKEQELTLIGSQVEKELQLNANEVVNGLYEIILASQESVDHSSLTLDKELQEELPETPPAEDNAAEIDIKELKEEKAEKEKPAEAENTPDIFNDDSDLAAYETQEITRDELKQEIEKTKETVTDDTDIFETYTAVLKEKEKKIEVPFPKSVVKTTRGAVIGEYYYDRKVYKNKRHYIYNSEFFLRKLSDSVTICKESFDQARYNESVQIIQDAHKRISGKSSLHFEVSTNEILNKNVLNDLAQGIARKEYDDILEVCSRLKAKFEALGNNYVEMLQEQMIRYSEI